MPTALLDHHGDTAEAIRQFWIALFIVFQRIVIAFASQEDRWSKSTEVAPQLL
jgi:hypothetical protein